MLAGDANSRNAQPPPMTHRKKTMGLMRRLLNLSIARMSQSMDAEMMLMPMVKRSEAGLFNNWKNMALMRAKMFSSAGVGATGALSCAIMGMQTAKHANKQTLDFRLETLDIINNGCGGVVSAYGVAGRGVSTLIERSQSFVVPCFSRWLGVWGLASEVWVRCDGG